MSERIFKNDMIISVAISIGVLLSFTLHAQFLLYGIYFFILVKIMASSIENNYYIMLFLLPNLRMFDSTGVTFLINMLIFILAVKCIVFNDNSINLKVLISSIVFLVIEFSHYYLTNDFLALIQMISWISSFIFFGVILTDKNILLNRRYAFWYLAIGIISSATIAFFTEPLLYTLEFINTGYRMIGLAGDPNFLSLYILIALFSIPNVLNNIGKIRLRYFVIYILLLLIGLLTVSKMFLLTYVSVTIIQLVYSVFSLRRDIGIQKKFSITVLLSSLLMIISVSSFFNLLFDRLRGRFFITDFSNLSSDTLNVLTSGRGNLVNFYIDQITSNIGLFLMGYGRSYHLVYSRHLAHNTYLDLLLSWGILGSLIFLIVLFLIIKAFKRKSRLDNNFFAYLPMISLLVVFSSLSAFEADMFFFVITYVLIQNTAVKRENINENVTVTEF